MCGIAGLCRLDGHAVAVGLVDRMIRRIAHRGPDELATAHDGSVCLGHARLSILDLEGGAQPMYSEDGRFCITYNGEIFNHAELRQRLMRLGHRFSTRSDTEVILHTYAEFGPEGVQHLNGQWAFAIWDRGERTLFLSRDPFGVRPLFYRHGDLDFAFASEIKALLAIPGEQPAIDLRALDQFCTFWSPLPSRTLFQGVTELAPGSNLLIKNGTVRTWRHWHPEFPAAGEPQAEPDAAEALRSLLTESTRLRLCADVPVAAYVSGGIDSSVVAALANRIGPTPFHTFSLAFDDAEFDESAYQRQIVAALETEHHVVRCTGSDIARVFPDVIWHAEKPMLRTAPAPLYLLSRAVHEAGFKVVLTGEGADEVLGGYDIFKESKIRRFIAARPESRLRPLLLRRLYPYQPNMPVQSDAYLRAFFQAGADGQADPLFSHRPRWRVTSGVKALYSKDLRDALRGYDAVAELRDELPGTFAEWDPFAQAQYLETAHLLPGYILSSQGDRMAMAHSVEGRFPFLDRRLAAFAAALPPRFKMRGLNEKYLLKRATRDLVPDAILRRKKQPYRAPDAKSFLGPDGGAPEYVEAMLEPRAIAQTGLFDAAAVSALVAKARSGRIVSVRDNMAFVGVLSTQLLVDAFTRNRTDAHDAYPDLPVHRRKLLVRTPG